MSVLVIHHGMAEPYNRYNVSDLAFTNMEAPLTEYGRIKARILNGTLSALYGIAIANTPAAASRLRRTQQTAEEAGFSDISIYPVLDDVNHGMRLKELRAVLYHKQLPAMALKAAEVILEEPPVEPVWFTSGLVIAGLCSLLGVDGDFRFIPRSCDVRELPIELPAIVLTPTIIGNSK